MAQRVVPFLHTPLEAPEFLDLWRSTLRNGVVRASEATTGGSGWKVTVKAGEVIIDGSWIYDDLDKIDGLDLGHIAGSDRHYVVYQTYAYAGSDPPATSVFAVTAGVAPPTQPTIPAGAVKLCDIFVPAAAASIEQAELDFFRMLGKQREVHAFSVPGGAQRIGFAWSHNGRWFAHSNFSLITWSSTWRSLPMTR